MTSRSCCKLLESADFFVPISNFGRQAIVFFIIFSALDGPGCLTV